MDKLLLEIKSLDTEKYMENQHKEWLNSRRDDVDIRSTKRRKLVNRCEDDSSSSFGSSESVTTNKVQRSASVELVQSDTLSNKGLNQ